MHYQAINNHNRLVLVSYQNRWGMRIQILNYSQNVQHILKLHSFYSTDLAEEWYKFNILQTNSAHIEVTFFFYILHWPWWVQCCRSVRRGHPQWHLVAVLSQRQCLPVSPFGHRRRDGHLQPNTQSDHPHYGCQGTNQGTILLINSVNPTLGNQSLNLEWWIHHWSFNDGPANVGFTELK